MVSIRHIFFLLSFLIGIAAFGQIEELGIPYYEKISPHFVGYAGPWGKIVQDDENVLYFENDAGVVVFDGANWKLHATHGRPSICRDVTGKIYVAAVSSLSEICVDDCNRRYMRSVLREGDYSFGRVSDVVALNGQLFFVAKKQLYMVRDSVPQKIDVGSEVNRILLDRNILYVATQNNLYEYDGSLKLAVSHPITVIDCQHVDDCTYFATPDGFVKITPEKIAVPFRTEIDDLLKNGEITCFYQIAYMAIGIGTKSHGFIGIDTRGRFGFSLNIQNGFPESNIKSIFIDKNNSIWITTFSNIIRLEVNPAITYYNDYNGLVGSVLCMAKFKGVLYVGTDCGVFKIEKGKAVEILHTSCSALMEFYGNLYAATGKGLMNLLTGERFSTESINRAFIFNKYLLVTVSNDSVTVWKEMPTFKRRLQAKIDNNIEITTVAQDHFQPYFAFFGTKSDGVWMTHVKSMGDSVLSFEIIPCEWQGLPKNHGRIDVFETSSGCLFSTSQGLFRCDCENNFFYRDGKILLPKDENLFVSPICEDADKNLWLALHTSGQYESQIAVAWNTNNSERYTLITAPFSKIRGNHITAFFPTKNSVVWLGGNENLVRMDFNLLSVKKIIGNVRMSQVLVNGDSLLSMNSGELSLPYNFKSILFDFVAVEYESHDDIQYSYYLEGKEKTWSHTTSNTQVEYSNLSAGKYIFHVKAKNGNGAVSKETVFEFRVSPNPLLSGWAFAFYGIVLAIVGFLHVKEKRKRKAQRLAAKSAQKHSEEAESPSEKSSTEKSGNGWNELQTFERVRSMNYNLATVLFSDFKGFTTIAKKVSAESLIQELEGYFSEFDKIVEKYNVMKIKTVGDSYMCAGGIPKKNTTNPIEVVAAALEMQYRLKELQKDHPEGAEAWSVRIGVHTGPIIAGIVDGQKSAYDIWGDSVNIASRMEASGEVGRVNVSESTFIMVREFFDCEYRGKIQVQGKEEKADMYFVNGFKAKFTEHPFKVVPNAIFASKLALLRFEGLQEDVYTMLEERLPKSYFYHSLKHTIDVVVQVEVIGQAEGVNDDDMYILKTAALFHDVGFIRTYHKHEQASMEIVSEMLPNEGYTDEQIQKVNRLIECTMLSVEPQTLLEKILCDADLDYLGRDDYICVSRDLYRELLEQKLVKKNEYDWNVGQVKFLQEHKYYTDYSRNQRNPGKVKHIQWLQEQITKFNNIN